MIYLDHNATTPVAEDVLAAMLPWFRQDYGNPSSVHDAGGRAREAVEDARAALAELLNARTRSIVFTSGATEANNLALRGACAAGSGGRNRVLISATEHKSVLDTTVGLPGCTVETVPVHASGQVDVDALAEMLGNDVLLVSAIAANNEVGTLNPLPRISELVHEVGAIFHADATQWVGKLPYDFHAAGADLVSLSAHKFYGPKGIGALVVGSGIELQPLVTGGGQEGGLRSGTLNVPGIVGLGAASRRASERMADEATAAASLRDLLEQRLEAALPDVTVNGDKSARLPNTTNVRFGGAEADAVLASVPELAASTGSACTSAVPTPSHVLIAMGLDGDAADESIRFSLGVSTTADEVERAVQLLTREVRRIRELGSPTATLKERVS
jgi:cysteine desulfurase